MPSEGRSEGVTWGSVLVRACRSPSARWDDMGRPVKIYRLTVKITFKLCGCSGRLSKSTLVASRDANRKPASMREVQSGLGLIELSMPGLAICPVSRTLEQHFIPITMWRIVMERRDFIKKTGLGLLPSPVRLPSRRWRRQRICPSSSGGWLELPQESGHDLWSGRSVGQTAVGNHRREIRNPGVCRWRDRTAVRGWTRYSRTRSRSAIPLRTTSTARTRRSRSTVRCRLVSPLGRCTPGIIMAKAVLCCASFLPNTTSSTSSVAIPARRWAAGSARKSIRWRI